MLQSDCHRAATTATTPGTAARGEARLGAAATAMTPGTAARAHLPSPIAAVPPAAVATSAERSRFDAFVLNLRPSTDETACLHRLHARVRAALMSPDAQYRVQDLLGRRDAGVSDVKWVGSSHTDRDTAISGSSDLDCGVHFSGMPGIDGADAAAAVMMPLAEFLLVKLFGDDIARAIKDTEGVVRQQSFSVGIRLHTGSAALGRKGLNGLPDVDIDLVPYVAQPDGRYLVALKGLGFTGTEAAVHAAAWKTWLHGLRDDATRARAKDVARALKLFNKERVKLPLAGSVSIGLLPSFCIEHLVMSVGLPTAPSIAQGAALSVACAISSSQWRAQSLHGF